MTRLEDLPPEIIQEIAVVASDDQSVLRLAQTNKHFRKWLVKRPYWVWKQRYRRFFDPPRSPRAQAKPHHLAALYLHRREVLSRQLRFETGFGNHEEEYLDILRHLIYDANNQEDASTGIVSGRSQAQLEHYVIDVAKIIQRQAVNPPALRSFSPLLQAIQLILSPLYLDPKLEPFCLGFLRSQLAAYGASHLDVVFGPRWPEGINLTLLNQILNFFKFHLTMPHQGAISHLMRRLTPDEQPQFWRGRLPGMHDLDQISMSRLWLGASSFVDEIDLMELRNPEPDPDQTAFSDNFDETQFARLDIKTSPMTDQPYSARIETRLDRYGPAGDFVRISGSVKDSTTSMLQGRLYRAPSQQGMRGWLRILFATWAVTESPQDADTTYLIYEGCVMPGGHVMMGRWWLPDLELLLDERTYPSGPWLFWALSQKQVRKQEEEDARMIEAQATSMLVPEASK